MMERPPECGPGFDQAASRFAVHVDLPGQRSERCEVVFSRRGFDPGQAIAAANGPDRTLTVSLVVLGGSMQVFFLTADPSECAQSGLAGAR